MSQDAIPSWTFMTNHAQVLVCIANDPGMRLREIAERVGITERAVHRIIVELGDAGYVTHQRNGRRNQYTINAALPIHDPVARDRDQNVGQLLQILVTHKRTGSSGTRSNDQSPVAS
jgi:predicted transcriptional regulator